MEDQPAFNEYPSVSFDMARLPVQKWKNYATHSSSVMIRC